jgi:heme/copper-type cytochrome/quinol oxidase subunit 3
MLLFIATEAMLFLLLFFSYFYLAAHNAQWPPKEDPRLLLPAIMTVLLISSSFVLRWGEQGIKRGESARLRTGLLLTIGLGLVFVLVQSFEYYHHLQSEKPGSSAYASIFYTTTSFHAAHLVLGLLMLGFVTARAFAGHFDEQRHAAVTSVSLYWHFVDIIWLFILAILYLSPRLH